MRHETISVVVPLYNAADFIEHTINSILGQSYDDFELLLVDDGSTDGSLTLCGRYAEKDARIRVIHQENGGVSAARNRGLEEAQGKYIAFVDADDILAPDYLERLMLGMRDEGAVLSMCAHARIRSQEDALPLERTAFASFPAEQCAKRLLSGNFPVCVCGGLLKSDSIGELRFPLGIRNNEDKYFIYRYLLANESGAVAFTNDRLYGYLVRDGSATRSGWNGSRDVIWVADRMAELTLAQHEDWRELAENLRLASRLDVMKSIVRADANDAAARQAFRDLREETLSFPFPKTGGLRLRTEYAALRAGAFWYRLLVWAYYSLTSEEKRFRTNEKQTRQD